MSSPNSEINFDQLDLPPDDIPAGSRWGFMRGLFAFRRRTVLGIGGGLVLTASAAWWYSNQSDTPPPDVLWDLAFELIDRSDDPRDRNQARAIAANLESLGYRDPAFAGGLEFVTGVVAFREAQEPNALDRERLYRTAVRDLRASERQALVAERRPEWSYALGVSLARTGRPNAAVPLLREAIHTFPAERVNAIVALSEIALLLRQSGPLEECAVWLSSAIDEEGSFEQPENDRALLLLARMHLQLGQVAEADARLGELSEEAAHSQAAVVAHAQTLMAREEFREAIDELKPLSEQVGLEQTHAREALFLMGVCAESLRESDVAINCYRRVSKSYPDSSEVVAAELRAAELLRRDERTEEALISYREALSRVGNSAEFHNPWLTAAEFRERVEAAWNAWVAEEAFEEAIALSRLMVPLFDPAVAARSEAASNEEWVRALQREYDAATVSRRSALAAELRQRWRASGAAFARLAETLSGDNSDALWTSADQFRRGEDFKNALVQITRFLDGRPADRRPKALIWRGEILMDLDRLDEALAHFQEVITEYPKNEAAFTAHYAIGRCEFERNHPDLAERAWREVLHSPVISPDAYEWRMSLFSLGHLLYHTADLKRHEYESRIAAGGVTGDESLLDEAYARWDECISRFEEYLKRYPESANAIEARFLMAKALQHSAARPLAELKRAQTDNARSELALEMRGLLTAAIREFRALQDGLSRLHEADRLEPLGMQILQSSYFEVAHTYYALEDYERAIQTYQAAANRFPQSAAVLLAYVQMTNCYDRLGQPGNARSMLEQASVILEAMSEGVFQSGVTNLSKEQWKTWLEWAKSFNRDGSLMMTGGA